MSAAEKLEALNKQNYTGPTAREESIGLALSAELPQIVAVVKAAEDSVGWSLDGLHFVATRARLRGALAALDDAL